MTDQTTYWDRVASSKVFSIPVDMEYLRTLVPGDGRILDYGCGYGRISGELRDAGFGEIVGVDTSAAMIERARRERPGIDFRVLTEPRLPFPDGEFDCAILYAVLTCIPSDAEQDALIREIARVLKPGGLILIGDYPLQSDERNLRRYDEYAAIHGAYGVFETDDGALVRHHSPDRIAQLASAFEQIRLSGIAITTMNRHPARGFLYYGRR